MSIAETIVQQLDHTRPDRYTPGVDVGAVKLYSTETEGIYTSKGADKDEIGVEMIFPGEGRSVGIIYDKGWDEYIVVQDWQEPGVERQVTKNVDCTTIGRFVWGVHAKPWTAPTVSVSIINEDGSHETVYEG